MDDGDHRMKEKDIIPQYMEELKDRVTALWHYKIPDNKFTGKKPFDVVGAYVKDGKSLPLAIEFKIHKILSPWSCKKVIEYQEKSLQDFDNVGGEAFVVLGIRLLLKPEEQAKFSYPTRRVNIWITWTIREFIEYRSRQTHVDIRALLLKGATGHVEGRSL
jgi:hypothetical protein